MIPSSPILMILCMFHSCCMYAAYLRNLVIRGSLRQAQKTKRAFKSGWISVTSCDITPKHPWVTLESTLQFTTKQSKFLKHDQIYSDLCMLIFVIRVIIIFHDISCCWLFVFGEVVYAGVRIRGSGENVYFWKHVGCYARCWVGVGWMLTFLALAHMLDATQDAGLGWGGC